jgi:hypothetical protein
VDKAVRACDAATWRLSRSHRDLNFHDINFPARAKMLAPPLHLVTIAKADERAMEAWPENFP